MEFFLFFLFFFDNLGEDPVHFIVGEEVALLLSQFVRNFHFVDNLVAIIVIH